MHYMPQLVLWRLYFFLPFRGYTVRLTLCRICPACHVEVIVLPFHMIYCTAFSVEYAPDRLKQDHHRPSQYVYNYPFISSTAMGLPERARRAEGKVYDLIM